MAVRTALFLIVCIPCLVGGLCFGAEPQMPYAIVIHAGAGSSPKSEQWIEGKTAVLEQALTAGQEMLKSGATSLDTVEAVVRILEDSAYCNAGKGAVFNAAGTHELDATIMDGRDRSTGAVGGVTTIKNPISLARRVMTHTEHVLLVAGGAEQFADQFADDVMIERVPNSYFSTDFRRAQLDRIEQQQRQQQRQSESDSMGTVGCCALDTHGSLAAATSTGGLTNKRFGRLGDSPIAGAGTYADDQTCAVSCTGIGEDFIRNGVARDVSARMSYLGNTADKAVEAILSSKEHPVRGGIIAVSHDGEIVMRFNTESMSRAAADWRGRREVHVTD
ncbi:isoaspartyl peptidase/L-asparaginase family protein [Stieleria varia]|uniref:Isoaspartyl peptidase n=1 Tax=Stieleria varia TaxID=2528005 RepID=A0A5C6A5H9_9BACT|nr:isoaspartyl peptidase/L-asparaginase [Stieleria varia]TWT94696.1 Isoaspartyl peptidase precursor [Stieleria varia]